MINDKRRYERQLALLGDNSPELLYKKTVMLCGLGGVGGYTFEALLRAGIGSIIVIDSDIFDESNLNRQLLCTVENIGMPKATAAEMRAKSVNPSVNISAEILFLTPDNIPEILQKYKPDYIADAIDNITAKLCLAVQADKFGIQIASCMGTGNKLNSNFFVCEDIYKTSVCPLAKAMRHLLKERSVKKLKVIYSKEEPKYKGQVVSSVPFVPAAAGLLMAEVIIKDLLEM